MRRRAVLQLAELEPATRGNGTGPVAFSPDGRHLAYGYNNQVRIVRIDA